MNRDPRFEPLTAFRFWRRLFANPDDTEAVFEIIEALRGRSEERAYRRFRRSATGARILAEERDILAVLSDHDYLASLSEGSLGRAYLEFMAREELEPGGLIDASEAAAPSEEITDPNFQRFLARWRDIHDLTHVVSGYGRDVRGEVALLAVNFAQDKSWGVGFMVAMFGLKGTAADRRLSLHGYRTGRRAAWLAGADWEALLPLPLPEVRRMLDIEPAPDYEPVWSAGAPAAA